MIRLILFILEINKAIAFDCQKKLTIAKIDKITEILPYKLIDYTDENLDAIQLIKLVNLTVGLGFTILIYL